MRSLRPQKEVGSITPHKVVPKHCEVHGHMQTVWNSLVYCLGAAGSNRCGTLRGEKSSLCCIKLSSARRLNMLFGLGCVSAMPKSRRNTARFRQMPQGQRGAFTESAKRRQYMPHAGQKAIYRWNGVRDEGCNATVRIHPGLNVTVCVCLCCWDNTDCCLSQAMLEFVCL